ncbi:MAG: PAS domain S-box protein, partial [Gammaproteobacteria bacterium]|nr:PAS domain S-box protein [Gammaproteobacteria bacterium]
MRDQELKQAHADLERTIKSSTAVFYTSKAYGDFGATFISDNIRHQLGYTPEEFLNDPGFWADHIHPDDKQRVFDQLSRVFEHGEHSHSYRFLDKQGNYRWMQDELRLTRDKDGKPLELTGFWTDITDRKLAEIQLQESEFRHRTIIDSMLDAVITIDSNGRIESFNAAAEEMFGYKTHEVLGNNIAMLMTAQHRDKHDHYINEFHQNGKNNIIGQSRELEALDRYGRVFPISLSVNEMRIADEIFYTGVIRDISLDKQAEQALQESEEKFRSIISASPMGVFIYELNEQSELIFSGYNPAADHILGVDCNRFLGKTIEDAFPALGQTEIPKYYRRAARDGISWQTEDLHYDDKQNITGAFNVYAFQTSPGKIAVMFSDVTERLRVQEELMRFKTTLDMTNDCVLMFYPDSLELFYVNQGTIQQSGYEYAELMGLTPGRLFPILTTAEIRKLLTPLESQDKGSVIVETTMQPKTGEQMEVELHLQYIHPSGEAARYVGIMRDITERKKVERLKNEFISTVSHELRTPLTSIRGALSLIQSGTVGKLTQKTRKMVDIASNNTERLLLLINDILDIQKIETGNLSFRFRPTQVMSLVEKAMRDNAAYGHQFNVEFKLTHRLDNIYILADEDRMMQVLNNLMSNAVKFSQPGDVVELAVARHEDAVRISVTDFGSGIPESFHDKVFDRFTQSDSSDARKKGGTGLGLSIAKAIVEKHGGLINFISHANVGTTMFFDMPFIKSHSDEDDSALPEYLSEHSPCLLIIEHDVDIALLLQRMLAEAGYNSTIAQDAATAEKLLACNNFKAITLDIDLLDAEGLDFFHRLRSHEVTRHIPVVAVSAAVDENRKKLNGGAIGIIDWINKPIDEQRLINAVKTAGY